MEELETSGLSRSSRSIPVTASGVRGSPSARRSSLMVRHAAVSAIAMGEIRTVVTGPMSPVAEKDHRSDASN